MGPEHQPIQQTVFRISNICTPSHHFHGIETRNKSGPDRPEDPGAMVFSVTPLKIDQDKNQNLLVYSSDSTYRNDAVVRKSFALSSCQVNVT